MTRNTPRLKNPLFFAAALPMFTNLSPTLGMHGPAYWGDYRQVTEGNPAMKYLLQVQPLAYVTRAALYVLVIYWLYAHLPDPFNIMATCVVFAGHIWGSSTWIHSGLMHGSLGTRGNSIAIWSVLVLYYVVVGSCAGLALSAHGKQDRLRTDEQAIVTKRS